MLILGVCLFIIFFHYFTLFIQLYLNINRALYGVKMILDLHEI